MKAISIFIAAIMLLSVNLSNAQSCCKKPVGSSMQALALNASFKASHEAPLPLEYAAKKGEMITYTVPGGADGHAFKVPADVETDKVLIVVHEWWGLNDYIKREAENWQEYLGSKVTVYAIDLYDGKVAATPDEAGKIMNEMKPERAQAIINGLVIKIGKGKKIATLGWCMGGSWSFAATLTAGKEAAGCVMYYGFPEKDEKRIKLLNTDVLYIYGTQDNFIKKTDVETFGKDVKATGHSFELHSYNAVHAFANPSNPKHDKKATAEAQAISIAFLKKHLGI